MPKVILVVGKSGAGKTTYAQKMISDYKEKGKKVQGVLSLAEFREGKKVSIHALNVQNGERRILARKGEEGIKYPELYPWVFSKETIAWVNNILKEIDTPDLLVIDELGPLEFDFHEGFKEAFPLIKSGKYDLAIITIRPELLGQALELWPESCFLRLG